MTVWVVAGVLSLAQADGPRWRPFDESKATPVPTAKTAPEVDDWGEPPPPLPASKTPPKRKPTDETKPSQAHPAESEAFDEPAPPPALWKAPSKKKPAGDAKPRLTKLSATGTEAPGDIVRAEAFERDDPPLVELPTLPDTALRPTPKQKQPEPKPGGRATKVEPAPTVELLPIDPPPIPASQPVRANPPANSTASPPPTASSPPMQTPPMQTPPMQTAPVQTAPVQTAPVQTAPVQTPPIRVEVIPEPQPPTILPDTPLVVVEGPEPQYVDGPTYPCWDYTGYRPHNWSLGVRSFQIWRPQPAGALLVGSASHAELASKSDFDFENRFAQEVVFERRFDASNGVEISGFMTEDSRRTVSAASGLGLDLPFAGPGADEFVNLNSWTGRASGRLWNLAVDFTQHATAALDSALRGRWFVGPRFLGLRETFEFGASNGADFRSLAESTLFGANAGVGMTLTPFGGLLSFDVSGRYGAYGNVYELQSELSGVGANTVRSSRFATTAEVNAEAALHVTERFNLIAGYRLWNTQGVGRALANYPGDLTQPFRLASNGNLLLHGVYVGAQLSWGGAADPNSRFGGARPYSVRTP